jgi:competence protein ComEC
VLIETLSAEIMTLPLVMMIFGQMSLVALLANVLIVPLVPLAMLLSAVAAIAGAALPEFAGWFAWPARMLLTYILDVVNILSRIPNVMQRIKINSTVMFSAYMIVLALAITLHKRLKTKQISLIK